MRFLTKRHFSALEVVGLLSVVALAAAGIARAVTVPNSFTAGTPARASEVNANFTALENAVTTLEAQVAALQAGGGNIVWKDATGAVVGSESATLLAAVSSPEIMHVDSSGFFWLVQTDGQVIVRSAAAHYLSSDCTGPAFISAGQIGLNVSAPGGTFQVSTGEWVTSPTDPSAIAQTLTYNSLDNPLCTPSTFTEDLIAVSDLIPAAPPPPDFVGPLHPERVP